MAQTVDAVTTVSVHDGLDVARRQSGDDDPNPFGFTGRELDETGLMHYRARYYAPELGRFISEDPLGAAGGDTNLYAYAGGDPTNVTDPSGMCLEPATELLTQTFALVDYLLAVMKAERDGTLTRDESAAESDWVIRQNNANMDWFLAMCGAEVTFAGLGAITGGLGAHMLGRPRSGPPGRVTPRLTAAYLADRMFGVGW